VEVIALATPAGAGRKRPLRRLALAAIGGFAEEMFVVAADEGRS